MLFVTFGDNPSGILVSQVIDVVKLMREHFKKDARLLCFVSLRGYKESKKYIQAYLPDAIVLPSLPKLRYWKHNYYLLKLVATWIKTDVVIARGIWAANLAYRLKKSGTIKKFCYDGRGAISAEVREYTVIEDEVVLAQVPAAEKLAVIEADYRIAVTHKLIGYWEREFAYKRGQEVVIPCTLSNIFQEGDAAFFESKRAELRTKLNWDKDTVIWVFSGSTAGWQSFEMLRKIFSYYLEQNPHLCILFLSKEDSNITNLKNAYPNRIVAKWLHHNEVPHYLLGCDYGIMIREQSVTNEVASPTKFAEYLMAGLKVITSENLGDYSDFVREHDCGFVINENHTQDLQVQSITIPEKQKLMELANIYFSKQSDFVLKKYQQLLDNVT
ncbi:MAG: hypothetical protein ACKVTZ_08450 [Bacteroidia bacterium]